MYKTAIFLATIAVMGGIYFSSNAHAQQTTKETKSCGSCKGCSSCNGCR